MELSSIASQLVPSAKIAGGNDSDKQQLKKACQDFEAVLLSNMMKGLRSTVQKSDLLGNESESQTFQEMMDQEMCNKMAHSRGVGLADVLFNQLSQITDNAESTKQIAPKS